MKAPLRLTHNQFADFFAELCDVIFREDFLVDDDLPLHHTSPEARRKANAIVERLADTGYLEYR